MKTLLIYGSKGWIASQIIDYIYINKLDFVIKRGVSRVDDINSLKSELNSCKPDIVLCCIGRTRGKKINSVDYLENDENLLENIRDNMFAPCMLGHLCQKYNLYCVYVGTGCIFDGYEKIFQESDNPNFFGSKYSIVKGFTDRIMKEYDNVLNLRIRMPVSSQKNERNFLTKITTYKRVIDKQNSMTVLDSMMPHFFYLISNNITGTINFTNPGTISHNEILNMYTKMVDENFTYSNFTVDQQNLILKSKRSNNHLDTKKLSQLCPNVQNIKNAFESILTKYRKYNQASFRILVTGGCGFIGSHMIKHLFSKYKNILIVNVDKLTYSGELENIPLNIRNSDMYKFYKGDICDENLIKHVIEYNKIDQVIHFAAETHVDRSFNNNESQNFIRSNLFGTHNLLECMTSSSKNIRFLHMSTDEVYGDTNYKNKVDETHELNPTNPYSASKAGAEHLVNAYIYSFKLDAILIRCNNVYGAMQFPEKLIPRFCMQCLSDSNMTVHGNGEQKRSFVHVQDVVEAIDLLRLKGKLSEVYNIGVHEEHSVNEVAYMIQKIFKKIDKIEHTGDRKYNDKRYFINNKKIRNLGWEPKIPFEKGLDDTAKWYSDNFKNWYDKFSKN